MAGLVARVANVASCVLAGVALSPSSAAASATTAISASATAALLAASTLTLASSTRRLSECGSVYGLLRDIPDQELLPDREIGRHCRLSLERHQHGKAALVHQFGRIELVIVGR
jgi:hypothetical protein